MHKIVQFSKYKEKTACRNMSFFTVISVHFRYHLSVLVPARFVTFFFPMERKIKVRLRRAVAGNCPPDSCIWVFKSDGPVSPKRKSTPDGVLFFLEVPARFELANNGFADRGLTTWLRYHMKEGTCVYVPFFLERVTRLELATSTLARWRSTG